MKTRKTLSLLLVLLLALALTLTACGGKAKPGGSETGELTLAVLKKAAKSAGFTVHNGWSTLTNWSSSSDGEPEDAFQISVPDDGSDFMGICVIEFASEETAKKYVAFAATEEAYFRGNAYSSGVFTVTIEESLVAQHEAKLMEAFEKAGWETSAPAEDVVEETTTEPPTSDEIDDVPENQEPYTGHASHLRGQNDTTHSFYVIGTTEGSIWGTDFYTSDSNIAKAAVHAGLVGVGEGAAVTIRILPGLDTYQGTTRNGVTSKAWGGTLGCYEFVTPSATQTAAQSGGGVFGNVKPQGGDGVALTLDALKKAVQDLGYDVRDDFMTEPSATIKPQAGFTSTYTSMGVYDIPFFEFKDNAEALAHKAENDKPDAMFPKEHIVNGRFAAQCTSLSERSGAECKKFIEDVFAKAGG